VGLLWGCVWWFEGKRKGETKNMFFLVGPAAYVHYINNIHQGALQSDCVIYNSGHMGRDDSGRGLGMRSV